MEFLDRLTGCMGRNDSLVCVGLDSQAAKLPASLKADNRIFQFNKVIIDKTADLVCAYKPNSAFYEALGAEGITQLKETCDYIKANYPYVPIILDAKRADIGSTNQAYAQFAFDYLGADAITLHPYLGAEALEPFLSWRDKGMIILCRTSNPGAGELQDLDVNGKKVYQIVAEKVRDEWNKNGNCLLVVGATYPKELAELRELMGDRFTFLAPGVGAQGGGVEKVIKAGKNKDGQGVIINSGRDIIFASSGPDYGEVARKRTMELRAEINKVRGSIV